MVFFTTAPRTGTSRPRSSLLARSAVAPALLAALLLTACGRTVTFGPEAAESAPPPPAASASQPEAGAGGSSTPQDEGGGGDAVRVVDGSAKDNGETGDGGTVVGLAVQDEPARWVQLSAVESPDLDGAYLINVKQAALYRFDDDDADPSRSTCVGDCAKTWPPVTIRQGGNIYLAGVDPSAVGAIKRTDGDIQLTVGGWPLYRFAQDSKPGDLKGQGVGGTWFAVSPEGDKVT